MVISEVVVSSVESFMGAQSDREPLIRQVWKILVYKVAQVASQATLLQHVGRAELLGCMRMEQALKFLLDQKYPVALLK